MIEKILGSIQMTKMMRKLRGGPQSMMPAAPVKGLGTPNASGLTPPKRREYVTPMQKPNWTVPKMAPTAPKKKV
ncbi:hypothetical protein FJ250_10735 [bacterium]|nr:hypothetical protein [bacterium]